MGIALVVVMCFVELVIRWWWLLFASAMSIASDSVEADRRRRRHMIVECMSFNGTWAVSYQPRWWLHRKIVLMSGISRTQRGWGSDENDPLEVERAGSKGGWWSIRRGLPQIHLNFSHIFHCILYRGDGKPALKLVRCFFFIYLFIKSEQNVVRCSICLCSNRIAR